MMIFESTILPDMGKGGAEEPLAPEILMDCKKIMLAALNSSLIQILKVK